jgi:hypothetical protein
MKVSQFLDDIEQSPAYVMMPPNLRPDRRGLMRIMSAELNELSAKLPDADFFQVWMIPGISTTEGECYYDLPDNFPGNFTRIDRERWACNILVGTQERILTYKPIVNAYVEGVTGYSAANACPQWYTISLRPDGRRQLIIYPPPDTNPPVGHYIIGGLYTPTDWIIRNEDEILPLPSNHSVLRWAVARRFSADLEPKFQEAYGVLLMEVSRNRKMSIGPKLGNYVNAYTLMRRP